LSPITLVLFLAIYAIPNIRILSVGENSAIPSLLLLILLRRIDKGIAFFLSLYLFLCLTSALVVMISTGESESFLKALSISIYITIIPLLLSILLGKHIGTSLQTFSYKKKTQFLKYAALVLTLLLAGSAVLNRFAPYILQTLLFAGRTSFGRESFFFTEPSSGAPFFVSLILLCYILLSSKTNRPSKQVRKFSIFTLLLALTCVILSFPFTFFVNISLVVFALFFIATISMLKSIVLAENVSKFIPFIFVLIALGSIIFSVFTPSLHLSSLAESNDKLNVLLSRLESVSMNQIVDILLVSGGFRFYYAYAAVSAAFDKLFVLPGFWFATFSSDLLLYIQDFNLPYVESLDSFLQLNRDLFNIKPLGWFYFVIYDIGVIPFAFFCIIVLLYLLHFRNAFTAAFQAYNPSVLPVLFSVQISMLIVPALPSMPIVFSPVLIASAIYYYNVPHVSNL
jgi:hypothetical protein